MAPTVAAFLAPSPALFQRRVPVQHVPIRKLRCATRAPDPISTSRLGAPKVISVGEALIDRLTSDANASFSDASKWTSYAGGAPANLACALAKLGTASAFIGAVGADKMGATLRALLDDAGVNVDGVQTLDSHPTRGVFVRHTAQGEGEFVAYSAASDECADAQRLDTDTLPGVLFYAAQIFACGTLALAFPGSRENLLELAELAHACRLRIVVDVNWRPVFWDGVCSTDEARKQILHFLCEKPGADVVKVSIEDARFLFGDAVAEAGFEDATNVLRAVGGKCNGAIVTAGERGTAYAFCVPGFDPVVGKVPCFKVPGGAVDCTGAGDAFLAGFLSEMFEKGGIAALTDAEAVRQMATFGAAVAAHVVAEKGAFEPQPSRERVEAFLERAKQTIL